MFFTYLKYNMLIILVLSFIYSQEDKNNMLYVWEEISTVDNKQYDFEDFNIRVYIKENILNIQIYSHLAEEVPELKNVEKDNKKLIISHSKTSLTHKNWEKVDKDYSIEIKTPIGTLFIQTDKELLDCPRELQHKITEEKSFLGKIDINKNKVSILLKQGHIHFQSLQGRNIYLHAFSEQNYLQISQKDIIDLAIFFLERQNEDMQEFKRPGLAH